MILMLSQFLAVVFAVFGGYYSGRFIAKYTLEEIKAGWQYLKTLEIVLSLLLVYFLVRYLEIRNSETLAMFLVAMFLFFVAKGSLDSQK